MPYLIPPRNPLTPEQAKQGWLRTHDRAPCHWGRSYFSPTFTDSSVTA